MQLQNVISFPQAFPEFARRVGFLREYRVGDRVNSVRGPGNDLRRRAVRAENASNDVLGANGRNAAGEVVFAAEVQEVLPDSNYVLRYDYGGLSGIEAKEHLQPRVRMP